VKCQQGPHSSHSDLTHLRLRLTAASVRIGRSSPDSLQPDLALLLTITTPRHHQRLFSPHQSTDSVLFYFRPSRLHQPASALRRRPPRHTPHRWTTRLHWRHPPRPPAIAPRHAYCSHSVNDSLLREYSPSPSPFWARHPPPPTPTPTPNIVYQSEQVPASTTNPSRPSAQPPS
jgi:hypothetical protein